jgi:hypothetical protein
LFSELLKGLPVLIAVAVALRYWWGLRHKKLAVHLLSDPAALELSLKRILLLLTSFFVHAKTVSGDQRDKNHPPYLCVANGLMPQRLKTTS